MAALFAGRVLVANNGARDELDTERELARCLDNKVLLLYFAAAACPRCRAFSPLLRDFYVRLTDEFYVERASQLVLVYVSRDDTEEKQSRFLKSMPKRWLSLPFEDDFKRELAERFAVAAVPAVVVLAPDGRLIAANAVEEIRRAGPACFRNWQEAAALVDRNFLAAEDFDEVARRSITDPVRRLKYKLGKKTRDEEEEEGGSAATGSGGRSLP